MLCGFGYCFHTAFITTRPLIEAFDNSLVENEHLFSFLISKHAEKIDNLRNQCEQKKTPVVF